MYSEARGGPCTAAPSNRSKKRKILGSAYTKNEDLYDYHTPTPEQLLMPGRVIGVTKYTCVVCDKGFPQLQQLNFHIRAHAGDERVDKQLRAGPYTTPPLWSSTSDIRQQRNHPTHPTKSAYVEP